MSYDPDPPTEAEVEEAFRFKYMGDIDECFT